MKQNRIKLNESQLRNIIKESIKKVLKETFDELDSDYNVFDNVYNDFVKTLNGNYIEVNVPDYCLPYLVNGDTESYTDEEIEAMDAFQEEYTGKLKNGLNVGDCCIPLDGQEPHFERRPDITSFGACDCYRFCLPLK